jgi:hypothetical protein
MFWVYYQDIGWFGNCVVLQEKSGDMNVTQTSVCIMEHRDSNCGNVFSALQAYTYTVGFNLLRSVKIL